MIYLNLSTIPPRVNAMYSSAGRFHKNKESKEATESLQWEAKSQYREAPLEGDLAVRIFFFFKNMRSDIDGSVKSALDVMNGIVYKDDNQILELHVNKYPAEDGHEHVEINVYEI